MTKNNSASKREIGQCRIILSAIFPNAIVPNKIEKIPLKIGVHADLLRAVKVVAPGVSRRVLKAMLEDYVTGKRYLKNMKAGATRVDLDGNPCGVVTDYQAAYAAVKLAEREEYIKNRWGTSATGETQGAE